MGEKQRSIDEKIRLSEEKVAKAKVNYDSVADELKQLLDKKKEMQRKELLDTFENSKRSYEEILEFLSAGRK